MKITKKQEKIVLNALTDSYLAIENELLSIGKEKYEYIPKSHWKQLRGIKEILEENKVYFITHTNSFPLCVPLINLILCKYLRSNLQR